MTTHSPAVQRCVDELLASLPASTEHHIGERFSHLTDPEICAEALIYVTEDPAGSVPVVVGLHLLSEMAKETVR